MASLITARRRRGAAPADPSSQSAGRRAARLAGRGVPVGMRRGATVVAAVALALTTLAPAAFAATALSVTTPYPSVVVAAGSSVSFDLSIKTAAAERVGLSLTGAPDSWKAAIHGGGFVIDAVQTNGTDAASARVDLTVPTDATGTTNMVLHASIPDGTFVDLPLSVRVDASATGDVTLKTDFPSLKGPSTQTFNFNLTLSNGTAEDLTFSVNAQGPTGWTIQANLTGQTQAASAVVKAGSTSGVTVSATPPQGVAAGDYNLDVVAVAGSQTIKGQLQVEITGTYTLTLATSDGRLNANGGAGTTTSTSLVITNTGTADVTNVKLSSSSVPSGWDVTFDTPTIATIGAGKTATVNAQIKPSSNAIAGDYPITLSVAGDNASSASVDIRYTVDTSLLWGIVGVALIVVVGAGIWWVFQRYGRR